MINCVNGCGLLVTTSYEGVTIDTCNSCMGVWLDDSELSHIVKTKDKSWSNGYIESITHKIGVPGILAIEKLKNVLCPKCNEVMQPLNYQYTSGVIINSCKFNHGVWLDSGELEKIQIYMEHWREKALENKSKYDEALSDVKDQHEECFSIDPTQGPSRFQFINAIFLGILQLKTKGDKSI